MTDLSFVLASRRARRGNSIASEGPFQQERQADGCGGKRLGYRIELNGSFVRRSNPFGNAQAKAAALDFVRMSWIRAVKALEYMRQRLGRDAGPGVGDAQFGRSVFPLQAHDD